MKNINEVAKIRKSLLLWNVRDGRCQQFELEKHLPQKVLGAFFTSRNILQKTDVSYNNLIGWLSKKEGISQFLDFYIFEAKKFDIIRRNFI